MSKLHWDAETVFGLPGMPEWANYAAIDGNNSPFLYPSKPDIGPEDEFIINGECECLALEHDYTGDWKDSLLERPKVIKPGDFGRFWDDEEDREYAVYGYLTEIKDYMNYKYHIGDRNYRFFDKRDPATLPKEIKI